MLKSSDPNLHLQFDASWYDESIMYCCFSGIWHVLRINLYIPVSNIHNEGTIPYALYYTYSVLASK